MANDTLKKILAKKQARVAELEKDRAEDSDLPAAIADEPQEEPLTDDADDVMTTRAPLTDSDDPPKSTEETLREQMGDDWEYLDSSTQRALIAVAENSTKREDAKNIVLETLAEKEATTKQKNFLSELDQACKARCGETFTSLVNRKEFEQWLAKSRKRTAIFTTAAAHLDKEASADLLELVNQYLRDRKGGTSPAIRYSSAESGEIGEAVTYEQYQRAVKDLRHASKRERAQKIIAQWNAQEN